MVTELDPAFKVIDDALETYYLRFGLEDYRDEHGKGIFLNFIIEEELNDPELPIANELGEDCDPMDCAYSWMNHDTDFPIPSYADIPSESKEAFTFYILQHCYKFGAAPSDEHIQSTLIPKCGGSLDSNMRKFALSDRHRNGMKSHIESPKELLSAIEEYKLQLSYFKASIMEIKSSDQDKDRKIDVLKQQMTMTLESLLRAKKENKYALKARHEAMTEHKEDDLGHQKEQRQRQPNCL